MIQTTEYDNKTDLVKKQDYLIKTRVEPNTITKGNQTIKPTKEVAKEAGTDYAGDETDLAQEAGTDYAGDETDLAQETGTLYAGDDYAMYCAEVQCDCRRHRRQGDVFKKKFPPLPFSKIVFISQVQYLKEICKF